MFVFIMVVYIYIIALLYHTISYYIIIYHIISYYIILYHIISYYIILYYKYNIILFALNEKSRKCYYYLNI